MTHLPALTYPDREAGHSSGWSGTDTSRDRAHEHDSTGKTATIQDRVLDALKVCGNTGLTMPEACTALGPWPSDTGGHSTVSSALTGLHKAGLVVRLTEERNRCKVYVLPANQDGRPAEPPTRNINARRIAALHRILAQAEERGIEAIPADLLRKVLRAK